MWVREDFMALNTNFHDVEKYYLKWLRVLWLCDRTWVWVLSMPNVCYLILLFSDEMFEV